MHFILEHSVCLCILEHFGTVQNILEQSRTFWNCKDCIMWKNFRLEDRHTDGQMDIRTCWAASSQLKTWSYPLYWCTPCMWWSLPGLFLRWLDSARCDYSLSLANDIQSDRLLLAIKDGQTKHCISIQNQILVKLLCCFIQISSVAVVISKRIVYFCSKFNLNLVSYWNCFGLSLFRYWPANLIAALLLFNLKSGHSK